MKGVVVAWEDKVKLRENLVKSRSHSLLLAFTLTCSFVMVIAQAVICKQATEVTKTFDTDRQQFMNCCNY